MTPPRLTSPHLTYEVSRIVELDENPVLRNLLITQCYHELSLELARVLGSLRKTKGSTACSACFD
jgi:hypothetical protein